MYGDGGDGCFTIVTETKKSFGEPPLTKLFLDYGQNPL